MAYGEGSIWQEKKKNGKTVWRVEVVVGKNPNGSPIVTRRTATTQAAARKLRSDLNSAKNQGKLTQQSLATVADFGRHWAREVIVNSVKPSTASGYEWLLKKYVYPFLGNRRMSELKYKDVVDWLNSLLLGHLSTSTVNSARAVLGQLCKQAVRVGILGTNPVPLTSKARKATGDKTQVKPSWTKEEAQEVLKCSKGTDMDLFVHLSVLMGLRLGETLGLKWELVDFEKRVLEVRFTLKDERRETSTGKGVVQLKLQEPKTKASIRKLEISETLFAAFERHKMFQSVRKVSVGDKWQESGMVFTSLVGTAVYQANIRPFFYRFLNKHGIRRIRIHDMRHTYGTLAIESGVPLEAVSQSMGHADIGITKRIYAPDVRGLNEKALRGLDTYLDPGPTVTATRAGGAEEITEHPLEVTSPVPLSRRQYRVKIDYRPKTKSSN